MNVLKLALAVTALLAALSVAGTSVSDNCTSLFRENRFSEAVDCLNSALYTASASDTSALVSIYEGLGVNYMMQNRKPLANASFNKLVSLRPDFELDPNAYLPEIVAFFQSIKLEARASRAQPKKPIFFAPVLHVMPLGIPQFQKGEYLKGFTVLALQAASLGISIYSYNQKNGLNTSEFNYSERDINSARKFDRTYKITFLTLSASYLYSVIDGFAKPAHEGTSW